MNTTKIGAHTRHTLSPCHRVDAKTRMSRNISFPAMLSTIELQRLVAEMVD